MVISQGDVGFDKGFWDHHESLNKWTLRFNEKDVEEEYRAHFTGDSAENKTAQHNVIALHQETQRPPKSNSQYRYSGVFIGKILAILGSRTENYRYRRLGAALLSRFRRCFCLLEAAAHPLLGLFLPLRCYCPPFHWINRSVAV